MFSIQPIRDQYKDYVLFCPFAYRMPDGVILAKDLAIEYKYLSNTSEFFYIARTNAERVIRNMTSLTKGKLKEDPSHFFQLFFSSILTFSHLADVHRLMSINRSVGDSRH